MTGLPFVLTFDRQANGRIVFIHAKRTDTLEPTDKADVAVIDLR